MSETTRLALPLILAAQAQKHVTHNDALAALDVLVHLGLASRTILTPPPTPAEGEAYLLDGVGTGSWAGQDGNIAAFINGDWQYFNPVSGWRAWVSDDQVLILFDGAVWQILVGAGAVYDNLQSLGINTTADSINRLSARTEAVLFSAIDAASGGIGDIQLKINKETAADTASLLFQTGFSGRAEMGLTGSDDWRIKVSADGAAWQDAIEVDAASGRSRFLQPVIFPSYTIAGLPSAAASGAGATVFVTDEAGGAVLAFSDGAAWRRVTDRAVVS